MCLKTKNDPMKEFIYVLFLSLLFSSVLAAQDCGFGGITFTSQSQIDNFIQDTQGCTTVEGFVRIEEAPGESITSLQGLSTIVKIEDDLIIIGNEQLTSLAGLEQLDSIGDALQIHDNPNLASIAGLASLKRVEDALQITNNTVLANLDGLESLQSVGTFIFINQNSALTSLEGLQNLTQIDHLGLTVAGSPLLNSLTGLENLTSFSGTLSISECHGLTDLSELENLTSIGGKLNIANNENLLSLHGLHNLSNIISSLDRGNIWISNNPLLTDLNALTSLDTMNGNLWIWNNDNLTDISWIENNIHPGGIEEFRLEENHSLSTCSSEYICNLLSSGADVIISDNGPECGGIEEVLFHCNTLGELSHPVFYDFNSNGIIDTGEPYYPPASITIEPGAIITFANAANGGISYLPFGTYTITYNQNSTPDWALTTDSSSFTVTLDSLINPSDTILFGIHPTNLMSDVRAVAVANNFRCNDFVNLGVIAENFGNTIASGTIWLEIDENILDINFIDLPDTTVTPNRYGWHFTDLLPGQTIIKRMEVLIPGPGDFPIGDPLYFEGLVEYTDNTGLQNADRYEYIDTVLCAYDPNDKLVNPVYPYNYALMDEDLVYTIRFQNTGNAEAFRVTIRDTLDTDLDPSTFRFIGSSHEEFLITTMEQDQFLTFDFVDINLPDSTTNFEGSQGYIIYRIRTNEGIPEETLVNNTAHIYFDQNPPIVTNTTENVMLSTFDFDGDGFDLFVDCDDSNAAVNQDATEIPYNGIDEDCNPLTLDDDLDQDGYILADDCDDGNAAINPGVAEIPYNGIDEDCNPLTLDDDLDEDGYLLADDCDDNNAMVNPGATEIPYTGIDEDCNPLTLDDDLDQDGYTLADDCDDDNAEINPDAMEIPYTGIDEDCNPLTLDDDLDEDGYLLVDDCDDDNAEINPGGSEVPYNGIDEDCNPLTLDDDLDEDGYLLADDCDDNNADINPDATEIINNGIDEDCDGEDMIVSNTETLKDQIKIFPNPTDQTVHIVWPDYSTVEISVRDYTGRTLLNHTFEKQLNLDLSDFADGVYTLIIQTEGELLIKRILKIDN